MSAAEAVPSDPPAPEAPLAPLSQGEASRPSAPSRVVVQASVLLGVSDHQRRITERCLREGGEAAPRKRAVGCLVGTVEHGVVTVTNSFPVPFDEGPGADGPLYLNVLFQQEMFALYHKVYSFEHVVGWYSTARECAAADTRVHRLFGFEEDKVLVCVSCEEPATATDLLQPYVQAFYFEELNGSLRPRHVPSDIQLSDVEAVVLRRAAPRFSMETYIAAVQVLRAEVDRVCSYLSRLKTCRSEDLELVGAVQDAINAISVPRSVVAPVIACEKNCLAAGYAIAEAVRSIAALRALHAGKRGSGQP